VSSSYARGNENNAYQADGVYYLGPGVSPGYAITNFRAHYDLTRLQLAVQIDNLFNHEYYTAAQLANTAQTSQGAIQSLPFPVYTTGPRPEASRAECHVLLAGRTEAGLGRIEAKVLIICIRGPSPDGIKRDPSSDFKAAALGYR
jgi:hypothetical protein